MNQSIEKTYAKLCNVHNSEELYLLTSYLKLISDELKQQLNSSENFISVPSFEDADNLRYTSLSGNRVTVNKANLPIFSITNFDSSIQELMNYYKRENQNHYANPYNTSTYLKMIAHFDKLDMKKNLSKEEQQIYYNYRLLTDSPYEKKGVLIYSVQDYQQIKDKEPIQHGFNFENNQYIKNPAIDQYNLIDVTAFCHNNFYWKFIACLQDVLKTYPILESRRIIAEEQLQIYNSIFNEHPEMTTFKKDEITTQIQKILSRK